MIKLNLLYSFGVIISILIILINSINSVVVPKKEYRLITHRCFNHSNYGNRRRLILGQNEPVGLSVENLISKIEKFERLNPTFSPAQIITMLLRRFHLDGMQYIPSEMNPSSISFHQQEITELILDSATIKQYQNVPFPEEQFTEDEKCNLFFTLSHIYNSSAGEFDRDTYMHMPHVVRNESPFALETKRDMGKEDVPITVSSNVHSNDIESREHHGQTIKHETQTQSTLLSTVATKKSRIPRQISLGSKINSFKTRNPREYGVSSFLSSETNPIAMNRVLLGILVGLVKPQPKTLKAIIKGLLPSKTGDDSTDSIDLNQTLDPLLAVTLIDIWGVSYNEMDFHPGEEIFGADGKWKHNVCHVEFLLNEVDKNWGTAAQFRGGIDGYNIGKFLQQSTRNNLTASQILRFYYSKQGLRPNTGFCDRSNYIKTDLSSNELENEAAKYLTIWDQYIDSGIHSKNTILSYIRYTKSQISTALHNAITQNDNERMLCYTTSIENDIRNQFSEKELDFFFLLDSAKSCKQNQFDQPQEPCKQSMIVKELIEKNDMFLNHGSVTIIYNAEPTENQKIRDDFGKQIDLPLFVATFNSTSAENAICKALFVDTNSKKIITDRTDLYERILKFIQIFDEAKRNETSIPGKVFLWIDFGSIQSIPKEQISSIKYDSIKHKLLTLERGVRFFSLGTNTTQMEDIVYDKNSLVTTNANSNIFENNELSNIKNLMQKFKDVPSILQYNDCNLKPSDKIVSQEFLTQNLKKRFAMYPKHFIKSYNIEFRFRAENSLIKVCFDRVEKPEMKNENCKVNENKDSDLVISINNPCKEKTLANCPPLYFTVSLYQPDPVNQFCTETGCKNINQYKWYIQHTGISCNGCINKTVSTLFLLFFISLSIYFGNKH